MDNFIVICIFINMYFLLPYHMKDIYKKKQTNSQHHSHKMAIGFSLATFRFQLLKVNLLLKKYYKVTRRVLLLLLFFLT